VTFSSESYTYVDEGDQDLNSFSIAHDLRYRIPLIRERCAAGTVSSCSPVPGPAGLHEGQP